MFVPILLTLGYIYIYSLKVVLHLSHIYDEGVRVAGVVE